MKRLLPVAGLCAAVLAAGCDYRGAQSLPLPGAVDADEAYRVTVTFSDATNLVVKETCRTNDTVIGSVESIKLDERLRAKVVCLVKNDVKLPANAVGALRETSLLGERYVALDPPHGVEPEGELRPGATLPESSTRVDPNAEMVLGALSQLLNGGSLGTIQTISREINTALEGSDFAATTRELRKIVSGLNERRGDIVASLEAMDRLAGRLADQRVVLEQALDSVPGGLAVLDRQRAALVRTLKALSKLSATALPLIERSQANTVADLEHLAPVLTEIAKEGDELALTLERVVTFPFPSTFESTVRGDHAGMWASFTLDIDSLSPLLGGTLQLPVAPPAGTPKTTPQADLLGPLGPLHLPPLNDLPLLDDLLGLLGGTP